MAVRSVWSKVFALHLSPLVEAQQQGKVAAVVNKYPQSAPVPPGTPVALRWVVHPLYGLARQPFQVFRRKRLIDDFQVHSKSLLSAPKPVVTGDKVEWGKTRLFDIGFKLTPAPGKPLTIAARDGFGKLIPGQQISNAAGGWYRLRCPGMASLEVRAGEGSIDQLRYITEPYMANNIGGWQLIQVVGLPVKPGEIGLPAYDSKPQGYAPANLSGYNAAKQRLDVAAMLQLPCPAIPGVPVSPSWPAPDPVQYLNALRGGLSGGESLFAAVRALLNQTDDGDPLRRQVDFHLKKQLAGLSQIGQPQPPAGETVFSLPVAGITMLHAATDSFAACGLGYGTTDLPPQVPPPVGTVAPFLYPSGFVDLPFDYMVVFRAHVMAGIVKGSPVMQWDLDLAALGEQRPAPAAPQGLAVTLVREDRPPAVDLPTGEVRELTWLTSVYPQTYGLAARRTAGVAPVILNSPRLGGLGYQPYLPAREALVEGKPPVDDTCSFIDLYGQKPFNGTAITNYWAIATDVFGRWSSWAASVFAATPGPRRRPGLTQVELLPGETPQDAGPLTGTLCIDFAWDWADRRPAKIELRGTYFPVNGQQPAGPPAGFAVQQGQAAAEAMIVQFDSGGNPTLFKAPADSSIQHTGTASGASAEVRSYRLLVPNAAVQFGAAAQMGYAAWVRGSEAVRPLAMSAWVGPRAGYVWDPKPPQVTVAPPPILWTELPDVRNKARARLSWGGDPKATGYFVWMATETPLAKKLGLALPSGIEARATMLKAAIEQAAENGDEDAIRAFSRMNAKAIPETHFEVELPGGSDTLFFYRISAVSHAAVESARSHKVFAVAVPRRIVPGQPALLVRSGADGIQVVAVEGRGPAPDGYALFRARNEALARDVGLMGPAKVPHDDAAWQAGTTTIGGEDRPSRSCLDSRPRSWFPYFYRVQAIGGSQPDDADHGRLRGESQPSEAQAVWYTPPDPPALVLEEPAYVSADNQVNVFTFETDLPARRSPLGVARIEVVMLSRGPDGALLRTVELGVDTHELTAKTSLPATDAGLAAATKMIGQAVHFYRSPTDAFPRQYKICLFTYPPVETVPDPQNPQATIQRPVIGTPRLLRLTDPLGRVTEVPLPQTLLSLKFIVNPGGSRI